MEEVKWGYQINSWANIKPAKQFWEVALKEIGEAGFESIELMDCKSDKFWVPSGREDILEVFGSKEKFMEVLKQKNLNIAGECFSRINRGQERAKFHDPREHEKIVEVAVEKAKWLQELGAEHLIIAPPFRFMVEEVTQQHVKTIAECCNKIGKAVLDYGVKASLHNHHSTMVDTRKMIDIIMEHTDPDYVWFCPDTAQLYVTGVGVYDTMREYADRIGYIHLKDAKEIYGIEKNMIEKMPGRRYYWELGVGKIDFEAVFRLLNEIKYDGWIVVECDGSRKPSDSAKGNKKFIEKKLVPILG